MAWLRKLNLQRKLVSNLIDRRGTPQTAAELAREVEAGEEEIEPLLNEMESKGVVMRQLSGGLSVYQINEAEKTVGKVLQSLGAEGAEEGMILLQDEHGWTAELSDPAGLLVRGDTREQAALRGRAVMQRMAAEPEQSERITS